MNGFVVFIQTDVEVEENKSSSVIVEILKIIIVAVAKVVVVLIVIVVVVVVVVVVAVTTFLSSGYKFGKSLLSLCTFFHTPSCANNYMLAFVSAPLSVTY